VEAVAAGGFAAGMRNFHQWPVFAHAVQDLIERDHGIGRPDPVFFERHELDEAHHHAFFAREHAERDDLVFVESAHQHAVDFHRPQTHAAGFTDTGQHVVISVRHAGDAGEAVGIDRVHAYGHAPQAGVLERLRHVG